MAAPPPPVETLPSAEPSVVSIRLASLGLLFHGPEVDPFDGSYDGRSGMEHLQLALRNRGSRNSPEIGAVEWVVPADEATDERRISTRNAIAGWCRAHTDNTENELSVMAKERRRAWFVGGLFFVVCFAIATALESTAALSGLGGTLLSETIVIAGWVGLWHPLDLTLYASWPPRSHLKLLERIGRLEVKLVPDLRDNRYT
jgi:hypothetical protein